MSQGSTEVGLQGTDDRGRGAPCDYSIPRSGEPDDRRRGFRSPAPREGPQVAARPPRPLGTTGSGWRLRGLVRFVRSRTIEPDAVSRDNFPGVRVRRSPVGANQFPEAIEVACQGVWPRRAGGECRRSRGGRRISCHRDFQLPPWRSELVGPKRSGARRQSGRGRWSVDVRLAAPRVRPRGVDRPRSACRCRHQPVRCPRTDHDPGSWG